MQLVLVLLFEVVADYTRVSAVPGAGRAGDGRASMPQYPGLTRIARTSQNKQSNQIKPLTWGFGAPLAGLEPATYGLEVRHDPSAWSWLGASLQVGSGASSKQSRPDQPCHNDRIAIGIASLGRTERFAGRRNGGARSGAQASMKMRSSGG